MELQEWKNKYSEDTILSIKEVIQQHIKELEIEVEYFNKKGQTHNHQDIWLMFLQNILDGKNPKRQKWSDYG